MSEATEHNGSDELPEGTAGQTASEAETNAPLGDGTDVDRLREENAELQDRLLRLQAELENFRRRTQKEASEAAKYQSLPVIRDLLPGIDNLQRAVDAAQSSGDTQNLIEGVQMVARQFEEVLAAHSARRIDPTGETFDPNLHEALSQIPSADHEPMTVLQVVEYGYKINDRIVRPAKVIVSCAPPQTTEDSGSRV